MFLSRFYSALIYGAVVLFISFKLHYLCIFFKISQIANYTLPQYSDLCDFAV